VLVQTSVYCIFCGSSLFLIESPTAASSTHLSCHTSGSCNRRNYCM